jgi:hypothetical protein
LERETFYKLGDIADLLDHQAKTFIDYRLVEPFEYSIDEDVIKELYRKFTVSTLFEEKVDIFLKVIAKSDSHIQLEDGTKLIFEVTPNKAEEWYRYNTQLRDFYVENFFRCSLDGLKENFNRKLKNFAHFETLRKKEFDYINKTFNEGISTGIYYWYEKTRAGEIPVDFQGTPELFCKKIYWGLEDYLQGKALAEYVEYLKTLNLNTLRNTGNQDEVKFQITGIDVPELVKELAKKKYFNIKFKTDVINWFNGTKPITPIPMDVRANFFLSIIADLCDAKPPFIKNKKIFCYKYIHQSFLFRGEKPKITYIEKVMKPNNENRLICTDKTIPDIQLFKTSV